MDNGRIDPPAEGEGPRELIRTRALAFTLLVLAALVAASLLRWKTLRATFDPDLSLAANAQPLAEVGGTVSYRVSVSNAGFGDALDVVVTHTLPSGFTYQHASTEVRKDGERISSSDPDVQGRNLTWGPFAVQEATGVFEDPYGVHTFVQDLCAESYVDFQLDKALELAGMGGHVTQLLYPVTVSSAGPNPCWVYFVERAYDRNLVPIVRLQGEWGGDYWLKPEPDSPGDYTSIAQAYKRVVEGLPRRDGRTLYVQLWNEPDVALEWSGEPSAPEYAQFFVDVAAAIHSIGDSRIQVLNGALTPGNTVFTRRLLKVPGFAQSFDLWASHCYPLNHPPSYNIHNGTARYPQYTIDCYLLELAALSTYGGRSGVKVMLTETGYGLYDSTFRFEGYKTINEDNRAHYMKRAFREFWPSWSEVVGVTPFELVDPYSTWDRWDWLYPGADLPHKQFTTVKALPKPDPVSVIPAILNINFQAEAADSPGTYYSDVSARAAGGSITPLTDVARVIVVDELHRRLFPLATRGALRMPVGAERTVRPQAVDELAELLERVSVPLSECAPAPQRVVPLVPSSQRIEAPTVLRTIDVGADPQGLALDAQGQVAFVTLGHGGLALVDILDSRVVCTVPTGTEPQGVAANPATGQVYVANSGDGTVSVVDGTTCRMVDSVGGLGRPRGVAIDPVANRIYVTDAEAGYLVAIDGENHRTVGRVFLGSQPDAVIYDRHADRLYVTNAGDGTLSVIEAENLNVVSTICVGPGPLLGMAIDGEAGRAYVVYLSSPLRRGIAVVDVRRGEVLCALVGDEERPLNSAYAVAINEQVERLYVADGSALLIVEPQGAKLLSSVAFDVTTYNFGLVADVTTGWIYLLDSATGQLLVLSD